MNTSGAIVYDAAIVGGGPVGLATALALQQAGFRVALIERGAEPAPYRPEIHDARVYAIAPESARFLDRLGVWPAIAATRISPYSAMRVWAREPAQALAFDAADAGAAQLGWIVEHGLILACAWSRLEAVDCWLHAPIEAILLPQADGEIGELHLEGAVVRARLIVAADGADSQLRELAGIETIAWSYPQRALICHIRTERKHGDTAYQRFLPSGPLALLPLADGRCSIVWSADTALADELMALDDAAFRARLGAASQGVLGEILAATPRSAVPLRLLHAREYVRPGLVLIGDAAHAIHPLAGQGVNLGFADAAQLSTTLVEARAAGRDETSLRTLSRYARARKAENLEMLALTDTLYRSFRIRLPGIRTALGLGLEGVDRLGPLKELLMRQAASA